MPDARRRTKTNLQASQVAGHGAVQQDSCWRGKGHVPHSTEVANEPKDGTLLYGKRENLGSRVSKLLTKEL